MSKNVKIVKTIPRVRLTIATISIICIEKNNYVNELEKYVVLNMLQMPGFISTISRNLQ